ARAATLGLPVALAIIGGTPDRFVPFVNLYRDSWKKEGRNLDKLQLDINSIGYIADTSQQASDEFFPEYALMMNKLGRERGWGPLDRESFEYMRSPKAALMVGSPQQIIDKILYEHELFQHNRFLIQMSIGSMPHQRIMHAIELFGTQVAPVVKKELLQIKN